MNTNSGAAIVADASKWQAFGKTQQYVGDNTATIDTYTDEVQAAFRKLELDLAKLSSDVSATEKRLRAADPHLDKALADPKNTPLIGADGGRTIRDSLADRTRLVEHLLSDFEQHGAQTDEVNDRLRQPLIDVLNGVLCQDRDYREAFAKVRTQYNAGCRDPLVIYSLLLMEQAGSDERFRLFQEGWNAIESRTTCLLLRCLITAKANEFKSRWSPAQYVEYQQQATKDLFDAVAEHATDQTAVQLLRPHVQWIFGEMNGAARGDFMTRMIALPQEQFPMWLRHFVAYEFAIDIANAYRGGHYISDTPVENLRLFDQFSEIGAKHLLRAWTLQPDCGALVESLMDIQSRAGGTPYSKHQWFRFAIANTCDDESIYNYLACKLVPKWGDSREQLAKYANLCSQVRFEDSPIPLYATHFLWCQLSDQGRHLPLTDDLPMLKSVLEMVDYLQSSPSRGTGQFYGGRAMLVLRVLWDWGRFSEIDWVMDNAGNAFGDTAHCYTYFVNMPLVRAVSLLAAGSHLPLWQSLHGDLLIRSDTLTTGKVERARLAIAEPRESTAKEATWALNYCERICDWWTTFNAGDPVTLQIDDQLLGLNWFIVSPNFVKDGFEFSSTFADGYSLIYPTLRFPIPHAIEADVEILKGENDILGFALFAGPVGGVIVTQDFSGGVLRYAPSLSKIIMDSIPGNRFDRDDPYCDTYECKKTVQGKLRLEVRQDGLQGFIDSSPLNKISREMKTHGFVQFGRYNAQWGATDASPVSYRVTNLRVIPLPNAVAPQ